jgi:hypothetical protein
MAARPPELASGSANYRTLVCVSGVTEPAMRAYLVQRRTTGQAIGAAIGAANAAKTKSQIKLDASEIL